MLRRMVDGVSKEHLAKSEIARLYKKGWKLYSNCSTKDFTDLEMLARLVTNIRICIEGGYEVLLTKAYGDLGKTKLPRHFALWFKKMR